MRKYRKVLAALLSASMVMTLVPSMALASEPEYVAEEEYVDEYLDEPMPEEDSLSIAEEVFSEEPMSIDTGTDEDTFFDAQEYISDDPDDATSTTDSTIDLTAATPTSPSSDAFPRLFSEEASEGDVEDSANQSTFTLTLNATEGFLPCDGLPQVKDISIPAGDSIDLSDPQYLPHLANEATRKFYEWHDHATGAPIPRTILTPTQDMTLDAVFINRAIVDFDQYGGQFVAADGTTLWGPISADLTENDTIATMTAYIESKGYTLQPPFAMRFVGWSNDPMAGSQQSVSNATPNTILPLNEDEHLVS